MIISKDSKKKALDKIQYPLIEKNLNLQKKYILTQ